MSSAETSPSLAAIVASVDPTLAGFRNRTSPEGMMTIVFTDIVGSTSMMERLGEDRWMELMHGHNRLVRDCVARHDGDVVKSQGDGFMAVFASAAGALSCSVELQQLLARRNERNPRERLAVRIGVHTGTIYEAEQDFLGVRWCSPPVSPGVRRGARSSCRRLAGDIPKGCGAGATGSRRS